MAGGGVEVGLQNVADGVQVKRQQHLKRLKQRQRRAIEVLAKCLPGRLIHPVVKHQGIAGVVDITESCATLEGAHHQRGLLVPLQQLQQIQAIAGTSWLIGFRERGIAFDDLAANPIVN
ncbi:hypothetical protein D9M71_609530 [compost metagenome]